jgi:hypothetical protein
MDMTSGFDNNNNNKNKSFKLQAIQKHGSSLIPLLVQCVERRLL